MACEEENWDKNLQEISQVKTGPAYERESNRVAEHYRNFINPDPKSYIGKQLTCIDIHADGTTLLGRSNMDGRIWTGSLSYFAKPEDLSDQDNYLCDVFTTSGVSDAKFLATSDLLLLGEDGGRVSIFGVTTMITNSGQPGSRHFVQKIYSDIHDDGVTCIEKFPNDPNYMISCGNDKCIVVWDAQSLVPEALYRNAQGGPITSVSPGTDGIHVFASGSLDHLALIWDWRQPKPARLVLEAKTGVTAVGWSPKDTNLLAVGTETGEITLLDVRQDLQVLATLSPLSRSIHKLSFSPIRPDSLALCGDDCTVTVLDCTNSTNPIISYRDERHCDFVRCVKWNNDGSLYSCGFDTTVLYHDVV